MGSKQWARQRERERERDAGPSERTSDWTWLAHTDTSQSKSLPPWFVSRTNIDLLGRFKKIAVMNVIIFSFFSSNDIIRFVSPAGLPYAKKCDWTSNELWQVSAIRSPPRHIHYLRKPEPVHSRGHSHFMYHMHIILTHWRRGHLNCLNARSRGF